MKFFQVLLTMTLVCFFVDGAMTQSVRDVRVLGSPLGNASAGEVALVQSSGLVCTAGQAFGSNIGVVDSNTNQLRKVIRPENLNNATAIFLSRVNQASNLVYFLRGSQIDVVDGRSSSPIFNQLLPSILFSGQSVTSFALDEERNRLYVTATVTGSNPLQGQVHNVDIDPASGTFHQIRGLGKKKRVTQNIETGNRHLKAVVLLGLDSGMRKGEILTLDWKDIDFDLGAIKILGMHTKTQKTRLVPMTDRTKMELFALPNFSTSGKAFPFNDFERS